MSLEYNKDIFENNYAKILCILQKIFIVGFVVFFLTVLVAVLNINITIPDGVNNLVAVYLLISIFGFPIIYFVKMGQERLLKGSNLAIEKNGTIVYERLTEQLWTIFGYTQEYKNYRIIAVERVVYGKLNYIIYGEIEYHRIYGGKIVDEDKVTVVKIPIAYNEMERMMKDYE